MSVVLGFTHLEKKILAHLEAAVESPMPLAAIVRAMPPVWQDSVRPTLLRLELDGHVHCAGNNDWKIGPGPVRRRAIVMDDPIPAAAVPSHDDVAHKEPPTASDGEATDMPNRGSHDDTEKQEQLLEKVRGGMSILAAAKAVGTSTPTVYKWGDAFKAKLREAKAIARGAKTEPSRGRRPKKQRDGVTSVPRQILEDHPKNEVLRILHEERNKIDAAIAALEAL